jgi:hypothetical protein
MNWIKRIFYIIKDGFTREKKSTFTLFRVLYVWDGIWSIPLSFLLIMLIAVVGELVFGESFAFFGPDIIQGGMVAVFMMVLFNFATLLGQYFNAKPIFDFITGKDFKDTFDKLTSWQKILFSFLWYFCYLLLLTVLFCAVV